ncbi:carbonic anhydrase family protein [Desertivirga xinjiangensis]|uniref:carbonic anhydrase family protein n=1 Tax=Desertivirga xinjiangensis TaxID=539206 RepID=UPI00210DCC8D|nr:carbonic anhydrase family protein [Pedobacter xinjiangensis]
MKTLTETDRNALTPAKAIELLETGNKRFVNNLKFNRNLLQQVNETSSGQFPFAFILSCIDSRTSAELIFDQGLGDVFSCRIAGNVLNEDILGSMEFACKLAGSKVIVVLGHTKCGAIKGACDHVEMGNLTTLLNKIQPAVQDETSTTENRNSKNSVFVENVAMINVHRTLQQITEQSPIIAEMVENGDIALVGAMYNVETGIVDFFEENIHEKA